MKSPLDIQPEPPTNVIAHTMHLVMTLDQCIIAWLHAKGGRSDSEKTRKAYQETLRSFRAQLRSSGMDLDGSSASIALAAQGWAGQSKRQERVAPGTYNQRLAILSSFYEYAIMQDVLQTNPIKRVERRSNHRKEHAARPIPPATIKEGLASIDRSTTEGKRNYLLLALALATGRRVSELAGLRYGHIQKQGTTAVVQWVRCKGNKGATNVLTEKMTRFLYEYLFAVYGAELLTLSSTAPVWVSFSKQNPGQAIGTRSIQRICDDYLETSKAHATRHTWAFTMHRKGAKLADIGKGLGHANLKTTSDYIDDLAELAGYENPYAYVLEDEFGI